MKLLRAKKNESIEAFVARLFIAWLRNKKEEHKGLYEDVVLTVNKKTSFEDVLKKYFRYRYESERLPPSLVKYVNEQMRESKDNVSIKHIFKKLKGKISI